jgi:hypothetical protein
VNGETTYAGLFHQAPEGLNSELRAAEISMNFDEAVQ